MPLRARAAEREAHLDPRDRFRSELPVEEDAFTYDQRTALETGIEFDQPDAPETIRRTQDGGLIHYATLTKLVEKMFENVLFDSRLELWNGVLLTHRLFTTSSELLRALRRRYIMPVPDGTKEERKRFMQVRGG